MRNQYRSPLTAGALALLVCAMSLAGMLRGANLSFADLLARRLPYAGGLATATVVLTADRGAPLSHEEWRRLFNLLDEFGARVIALTDLPRNVGDAGAGLARAALVQGLPVAPSAQDPSHYEAPAAAPGVAAVPVVVPTPDDGTYREQFRTLATTQGNLEPLETVVARRMGRADVLPATARYLIDFSYLPGTVPRLGARRALAGGLVPEMVEGRAVLIEGSAALDAPRIFTPLSHRDALLSAVEFHAYALNTLLNDRAIVPVPPWLACATVLLVAAVGFVGFQRLDSRSESSMLLLLLVVYLPLSWALYHHGRVLPPTAEIFLAFAVVLGYVFSERTRRERRALGTLVVESSARLQRMVMPTTFFDSAQYWTEVIRMVDQTLTLTRAIFLDRVTGDHRVREVVAQDCDVTDIDEKRRDYERTPYTTAIAQNGPIRVERYLKSARDDEQQYLVPLLFAGEVQGFWAFGVAADVLATTPGFDQAVKDFAEQIAQLLYHRRQWVERRREARNRVRRYLELQAGDPEYRRLNNAVALIEQRLRMLESLFDGLATATILYNLFGRVLQANREMSSILQREGIRAYEMTAGDLVGNLAGLSLEEVRPLVRRLVLTKQTITLQSRVLHGRLYVMRLRPMHGAEDDAGLAAATADAPPFHVEGILLELVDITDVRNLRRLKEDLLQRAFFAFNNDIGTGLLAASLIGDETVAPGQRAQALAILGSKLEAMQDTLREVRDYLGEGFDADARECYPINAVAVIDDVLLELEDAARGRGITVRNELPELMNLVIALPSAFANVVRAILAYLLEDAVSDSTIDITASPAGERVAIVFANTGFGIPQARMDEYLASPDGTDAPELRELRLAAREVERWDGQLAVRTAIGTGTTVTLSLKALA